MLGLVVLVFTVLLLYLSDHMVNTALWFEFGNRIVHVPLYLQAQASSWRLAGLFASGVEPQALCMPGQHCATAAATP